MQIQTGSILGDLDRSPQRIAPLFSRLVGGIGDRYLIRVVDRVCYAGAD